MCNYFDEIKERIRERLSPVDLLQEYGRITAEEAEKLRRGQNILCPFHEDHQVSFSYDPEGKIVSCFGVCGWTGKDVFDVCARCKNLDIKQDFPAIIRELAEIAKISPTESKPSKKPPPKKSAKTSKLPDPNLIERRQEILEAVIKIGETNFWSRSGVAGKAREYAHSRKWEDRILREMRVGLFNIHDLHQSGKFSDEDLRLVGLLNEEKKPIFRGWRLFFPVIVDGKPVYGSFGKFPGGNENGGKYVHLHKGPLQIGATQYFYNQDTLKESDEIYIAEGVSDTITLKHWINNVCGVLGVGNCPNPEILKDKKRIILSFDRNDSGVNGAEKYGSKILRELGKNGPQVFVRTPPEKWKDQSLNKDQKDWSDLAKLGFTVNDFNESQTYTAEDEPNAELEPVFKNQIDYSGSCKEVIKQAWE